MQKILSQYPFLIYLLPLLLFWLVYGAVKSWRHRQAVATWQESVEARLTEPASLHPLIDPAKCLGCGACVKACPEGEILGLVHGKAQLVSPADCIGHGACRQACPFDAINLVFGTETRGVDLPQLKPNFETNVPGLYIAGELGGMGLIRNAIEQGSQAVRYIGQALTAGHGQEYDLVIVGAGPAGIAASLAATEKGLNFLTIDQDSMGGTVSHFPRNKIVMTAPVNLPLIGKTRFGETTKEALLLFWQSIIERTGLKLNFCEQLLDVAKEGNGFRVTTSQRSVSAHSLLLCMGRRGTPRQLNVPGEELNKVVYRLIDPAQYQGQKVLVVGGGDSALEAACSIADEEGTEVTLSYRADAFSRAKAKNRQRLEQALQAGRVKQYLQSEVTAITSDSVELQSAEGPVQLANDAVIICAGGVLPTPFLQKIGIEIETKYGTA